MVFSKKVKEAAASFIGSCRRYESTDAELPSLDDIQLHWIEVWGVSCGRR